MVKRNVERWKPVKRFKGYMISNMGQVKSLKRIVPDIRTKTRSLNERILKQDTYGPYRLVKLSKNKRIFTFLVHLLVIHHFGLPKPSPKHECNHKDGIKINNWNTNLEWMTRKENGQHAYDTGLNQGQKGEKNSSAKLTDKKVKKIRSMYGNRRHTQRELGIIFKVNQATIHDIVNNIGWQHLLN